MALQADRKVMTVVKRFKYQGLVTLHADEGKPCPELGRAPRRMVMRAWDDETGRSQLFSTLVSCEDDAPVPGHGHRIPVTLRVAGDDVADYLGVGRDFVLWLEGGVGEGTVTGRVFLPI
jgi:hypothetical protein